MSLEASAHALQTPSYDQLVLADRVHGSIYTNPVVFDDEMHRIFHRGWVFVGHESEIPAPGDFRARTLGRQPVIFVRGDDGVVRVLMNRCTHRGTLVCAHERGNSRLFVCAYHGWSFRNTGQLAGVPYAERYGAEFSRDDYGLRAAPRYASYRGFMFASLASHGIALDEHLGPLARAEVDLALDVSPVGEIDASAGTHKYGYAGNWKLQLENSADAYHVNYLHRSYLQLLEARHGVDGRGLTSGESPAVVRSIGNGHIAWDMSPYLGEMNLRPGGSPWHIRYVEALIAAHGEERARSVLAHAPAHLVIFPNLVIIASQLRIIRPISVNETEVFIHPTLLKGVPDELNQGRLREHESFYGPAGGGATDDIEVLERVAAGLRAEVDPWILISRGHGREQVAEDGARVGQLTDELSNRAILQHWKTLMLAASPSLEASLPSRSNGPEAREGRSDA